MKAKFIQDEDSPFPSLSTTNIVAINLSQEEAKLLITYLGRVSFTHIKDLFSSCTERELRNIQKVTYDLYSTLTDLKNES